MRPRRPGQTPGRPRGRVPMCQCFGAAAVAARSPRPGPGADSEPSFLLESCPGESRVRVTVTVVGSDSLSLRVTTPFVVAGWVHSWAWTSASEFGATLAFTEPRPARHGGTLIVTVTVLTHDCGRHCMVVTHYKQYKGRDPAQWQINFPSSYSCSRLITRLNNGRFALPAPYPAGTKSDS